jgi:hypothetical protein
MSKEDLDKAFHEMKPTVMFQEKKSLLCTRIPEDWSSFVDWEENLGQDALNII